MNIARREGYLGLPAGIGVAMKDPYDRFNRFRGNIYSRLGELEFAVPGSGNRHAGHYGLFELRGFIDGSNLIIEYLSPTLMRYAMLYDALENVVYINCSQSTERALDEWLEKSCGTYFTGIDRYWVHESNLQARVSKKEFTDAFRGGAAALAGEGCSPPCQLGGDHIGPLRRE